MLRPLPRYGRALQGVTEQENHVKGLEASLAGGKDQVSQRESTAAEAQSMSSLLVPSATSKLSPSAPRSLQQLRSEQRGLPVSDTPQIRTRLMSTSVLSLKSKGEAKAGGHANP